MTATYTDLSQVLMSPPRNLRTLRLRWC